jgi:phosphonate transport system substrate-binding protein
MNFRMRLLRPTFLALLSLLLISPPSVAENQQVLTFGVVPQQAAKKLAKKWGPLFQYIGERAGVTIRFKTAPNIPEFERRLSKGEYDLAYMNPYHYTVFGDQPGYRAFAKQKNKRIKGIMVARKDTTMADLKALNGNKLAFPAPAAFAASILTRAHLKEIGVDFTPKYVKSHDSVYRAVAKGLFPSGGGVVRTFNNTEPEIRDQLKIFWTSNTFTPHAFAAHPSVDSSTVDKVQQILLAMNSDPQATSLIKAISFKGFEAAQHSDWDDVRALKIDLLDDL